MVHYSHNTVELSCFECDLGRHRHTLLSMQLHENGGGGKRRRRRRVFCPFQGLTRRRRGTKSLKKEEEDGGTRDILSDGRLVWLGLYLGDCLFFQFHVRETFFPLSSLSLRRCCVVILCRVRCCLMASQSSSLCHASFWGLHYNTKLCQLTFLVFRSRHAFTTTVQVMPFSCYILPPLTDVLHEVLSHSSREHHY